MSTFIICAVTAVVLSFPICVKNENFTLTADLVSKQNNKKHLSFVDMKIQSIERGSFRDVEHVDKINVSSNEIREIQGDVFNNLPIRSLDLNNNLISRIDSNAFENMTRLSEIWLAKNKLKKIDAHWFKNCPKINVVMLASNLIDEIPARAFQNLETNFPVIVLRYNKIRVVSQQAFVGTKSFGVLDLYGNELDALPNKLFPDLKNAFAVDLGENRFTCLSLSLLSSLVDVEALGLRGNNFTCECLNQLDEFGKVHQTPYMQYDIIDCP